MKRMIPKHELVRVLEAYSKTVHMFEGMMPAAAVENPIE